MLPSPLGKDPTYLGFCPRTGASDANPAGSKLYFPLQGVLKSMIWFTKKGGEASRSGRVSAQGYSN
jgi:hypothetical protein